MGLQLVGAGLGRTGTASLKIALEQLLGGPCYHMSEVFGRPDMAEMWLRAVGGDVPDWDELFADYRATVDWPVAAFWREVSAAYPDAPVLLSTREADAWWESASHTIFPAIAREQPPGTPIALERRMIFEMFDKTFTPGWQDPDTAKAAYLAHNAAVRAAIPADRLVEWHPGDGWGPLCAALDLPVPDAPFPHVNTTDEFRQMAGLDESG
jgi:Sulfotransferase domain